MLGIDKRLIVPSTSRWLGIGIAVGVLSLLASLLLYLLVGRSIDAMLRGENLLEQALPWAVALLAAKFVLGYAYRAAQYRASSLTKLTIRDKIYEHALRLGPAMLDRKRTGELVNVAVDGMDWIELFYGIYFVQFVVGMATPLLLCLFIGSIDWVAGVALVVSVPLTPIFLGLMARNFRRTSRRYAEVNNEQSAQFLDSIQGMTTLKMFNLGARRGREMHAASETQRRETMRLLLVNQVMILFVDFGFALGTTLVLAIVGLLRMDAGALTPGELVAILLASAEFAKPLTLIGQFFFAGAIGREFAKKTVAFLEEKPAVLQASEGQAEPVRGAAASGTATAAAAPCGAEGSALELRDVTFRYPGAERAALASLSLEVRHGETVAIVGPSGSGKTTLTNLLLRTLAPEQGRICINGRDVERTSLDWVRAQVALVPQDPYLFYGTIAENLRIAKPDASEAELESACRAANIYDHIAALPDGFATRVGERGHSLSGGQVQRIAIARALLKAAPIVVLDEPTSQIDLETETVIQQALARLTQHKTVLLVAHRLSTVEHADRIVVVAQGRVVEQGSHAELLRRGGMYARMVGVSQQGTQAPAAAALAEHYA